MLRRLKREAILCFELRNVKDGAGHCEGANQVKPEKAISRREQERQIIAAECQRLGIPEEAPA